METYRSEIALACVIGYMVLCVVIGIWAMRRTRNTHDFFMAGRHLGSIVASVAVFSSIMSGWGFVGGPGLVYKMGTSSFTMCFTTSIGICLVFFLLAKRLRLFAELRNPISLPDAIRARYGCNSTSLLTAIAILLGVIGYLATQILAMAIVLQDILRNISFIGELDLWICLAISTSVLVFYCVTGGIIASVYTDLIQGLFMIVAAVLVFFTALNTVDGGLTGMATTILEDDPESMGPWGSLGMVGCISWFFIFSVGMAGQPHVITKLMMTKKVDNSRTMLPISIAGYALSALLWIGIGLAMRALVLQGQHEPLSVADHAAPEFLQRYAHPLLSGVVFAGLLSAIMSTADGFLNIGAAAVVHDIPRAVRGRSLRNELLWARTATVVIAVLASIFALKSEEDMVALLGALGWTTFAVAIVPTVAIGFNWRRATPLACNLAIVSGLIVNFGLRLLDTDRGRELLETYFGIEGYDGLPHSFYGGAMALLVSLTIFFVVSICSKPCPIDPDIDEAMQL